VVVIGQTVVVVSVVMVSVVLLGCGQDFELITEELEEDAGEEDGHVLLL
jgi:hypothetical protein